MLPRLPVLRLPAPAYRLTDDLASTAQRAASHFPVVVKPLSSAGSVGVELVADADAFETAAHRRATEGPLLVETALPFRERGCTSGRRTSRHGKGPGARLRRVEPL
ncbi:hypothetical protein ACQ5JZ_20380 [Streptomyces sp. ZG43]|uniref:hypothetical protein n=1 Tax=Streptomyces albidoflavus TaxID=1886 RepID=UPI0024C5C12F|nr:hypothetical protein NQP46_10735 [Streptomyces albus]